jgi:hypothetical protein
MFSDARFVAEWVVAQSSYKLTEAIPAFEIISGENGAERFGPVCRLPAGAELEACGEGFNQRSLKVQCGDRHYFVFLQDLPLQPQPQELFL